MGCKKTRHTLGFLEIRVNTARVMNLCSLCRFFFSNPSEKGKTSSKMSKNDEVLGYPVTPEHAWLASLAGEWSVRCLYFMGSPDAPIEVRGKETVERLGHYWIFARFEADVLGSPMQGQAATGYDPVKRRFIGTWKDTSTPFHYSFEGTMEETGTTKTLRMSGENYDPMRQCPAIYHSVIEYLSPKERILHLSVESENGEIPILEYHYKKK